MKHKVITIDEEIHAEFKARCKLLGLGMQTINQLLIASWLRKTDPKETGRNEAK